MLRRVFKCISWQMPKNYCSFYNFTVQHVFKDENTMVNDLAQQASSFRSNQGNLVFWKNRTIQFTKPNLAKSDGPSSETGGLEFPGTQTNQVKQRHSILVHYLENPSHIADRKVQRQALKYVVLDSVLYHRTIDSLLFSVCLLPCDL
jgi:hypothetical protein